MEMENDRVNKRNYNLIKDQNKLVESKELSIDKKWVQEDGHLWLDGTGMMEKEMRGEGDRTEGEGAPTPRINDMSGHCAICHLTPEAAKSNFNKNVPCSQNHTLCQRCIQHFTIQLDPNYILCQAQYQQSNTNLLQENNASLTSIKLCPKRSQLLRYESEYKSKHYQHGQRCASINNTEHLYAKSRNQKCTPIIDNIERNECECSNDDFEMNSNCERSKEQSNVQRERSKDVDKRNQQSSYHNLFEKGNTDLYGFETTVNRQIAFEYSRKPIRCPRIDCAMNVAFSALTHHFIFDHPEVPILNVESGIKSTLIVSFNALCSDSSRCLALLLVSGKLSDPVAKLFNGNQINTKFRNRLPLSVLAARLHCKNQYASIDKINQKNDFPEKDVIIAWVAGLDIGNTTEKLLCSIQAVDKIDTKGLRSLTYTGPVNSLRTAQYPEDIFSTGDCIVLHEGFLSRVTSDCATLNVNVTVH